jgi:hypothetical protein
MLAAGGSNQSAFVLTGGRITAEWIPYCYPTALTPWELKDRAEQEQP